MAYADLGLPVWALDWSCRHNRHCTKPAKNRHPTVALSTAQHQSSLIKWFLH